MVIRTWHGIPAGGSQASTTPSGNDIVVDQQCRLGTERGQRGLGLIFQCHACRHIQVEQIRADAGEVDGDRLLAGLDDESAAWVCVALSAPELSGQLALAHARRAMQHHDGVLLPVRERRVDPVEQVVPANER